MEMYQVIRYFLNEMEKKIWHALLTLVLFCLYISIFDVPFTIKNTFIGRLLFPKAFMNAGSANLIFYLISFFGFLWSIFIFAFGNIRSLYFAFSDSFCLHLYLFAGPWRRFQLYTRISFTARVNLFNEMVPLPW